MMSARVLFFLLTLVLVAHPLPVQGGDKCCPAPCVLHLPAWAGIYPTVLTPWCCGGGVDEPALAAQIQYQMDGGVHGLLVLGTIGEGEYALMEERAQVIRVAVMMARGCVPVVAGIHTCDVEVAKTQLIQAKDLGAKAVLVKYVGNPGASGAEVLAFFQELSSLDALPIFYYHYPSQTCLRLTPCEIAEILMLPGVVGIKESTLDLRETAQHIALTQGHGKTFLSGTALNLTQFMDIGGHGAMCPEAALLPGLTVHVYQSYVQGNVADARAAQKDLFVIVPVLKGGISSERSARFVLMAAQDHEIAMPMGNDHPQARLKATLNGLGICMQTNVASCLPQLSRHDEHKVKGAVKKICNLALIRAKCVQVDCLRKWPLPPVNGAGK